MALCTVLWYYNNITLVRYFSKYSGGKMLREAIYHKQYSEYAYPLDESTLLIRIRTRKNEITTCILYYEEKYDSSIKGKILMYKAACDELFDYFEAKICAPIKRFKYMFYLEDAYEALWFNQNGFHKHKPAWGHFSYSCICPKDIVKGVEWFEDTVIYQIFPDRFKKIDVGNVFGHGFYGGNIKGLISEFDYIKSLGVKSIYLNPVFKAKSYHRYDTIDYYQIDPILGNKEQIKDFIDLCHASNIKVIFDAVLNHTGSDFFAFRDVVENGPKSRYKDWFYVHSFPVLHSPKPNYECFSYFSGMPKLNTANPEVVDYLTDVLKYWTNELDIDGWRFDVADEMDRSFIRHIRRELKTVKKDIVLIGEIFDEASSWLGGDQFDSVINYQLKNLINDLFAYRSIDAELFVQRVGGYLMNLKTGVLNNMVNVIGTHDTARFLTLCGGCEKRFELAVVFQFTFSGVPMIYYGDEIGMKGGDDPDCRKPMIWDKSKWNMKFLGLYRFLIRLREEYEALRKGSFVSLKVEEGKGVLAFGRKTKKEFLIIIINTNHVKTDLKVRIDGINSEKSLALELKSKEIANLDDGLLKDTLKSYQWKIYKLE